MPNISLILAPVDFSAGSDSAAAYAAWLASRLGARLRLLHAFVGLQHAAAGVAPGLRDDLAAADRELREQAQRDLEALAGRLAAGEGGGARPETALVDARERVAEAIVQAADEAGADLIVMGSHGRTGVRRMLLGSVAEWVVRSATRPVLTVK